MMDIQLLKDQVFLLNILWSKLTNSGAIKELEMPKKNQETHSQLDVKLSKR